MVSIDYESLRRYSDSGVSTDDIVLAGVLFRFVSVTILFNLIQKVFDCQAIYCLEIMPPSSSFLSGRFRK